jgi:hypothetical protein
MRDELIALDRLPGSHVVPTVRAELLALLGRRPEARARPAWIRARLGCRRSRRLRGRCRRTRSRTCRVRRLSPARRPGANSAASASLSNSTAASRPSRADDAHANCPVSELTCTIRPREARRADRVAPLTTQARAHFPSAQRVHSTTATGTRTRWADEGGHRRVDLGSTPGAGARAGTRRLVAPARTPTLHRRHPRPWPVRRPHLPMPPEPTWDCYTARILMFAFEAAATRGVLRLNVHTWLDVKTVAVRSTADLK